MSIKIQIPPIPTQKSKTLADKEDDEIHSDHQKNLNGHYKKVK